MKPHPHHLLSQRLNTKRHLSQNFQPWIHLTPSDFESLTRQGDLCNKEGALEYTGFETVMREQVIASEY